MKIRDRIKELRRVKASSLRPHPKNWRTHPQAQQDALRGVLAELGYADALLARELPDGSLELIDGHLRAETTPEAEVPVLVLDLDDAEAAKLLALHDPLAAMAGADGDVLAGLLDEVETENDAVRQLISQMQAEPENMNLPRDPVELRHLNTKPPHISRPTTVFLTVGVVRIGGGGGLDEVAGQTLGIVSLPIPPGISGKLHAVALDYLLARARHYGIIIVEAVEALSSGNARYLGVRLEPKKHLPVNGQGDEALSKRISGTKEWSVESVNILLGCAHKCRYCYARANALRRRQIPRLDVWGESYLKIREKEVNRRRKNAGGTVMFPSTHDILPQFLEPCLTVIRNILAAGNRLLIVSKPHLECIQAICREFGQYRGEILFRFTIGAIDDAVLKYWEPGAPPFDERLASLRHAHCAGFQTSVSAEPLLESAHAVDLFHAVEPYVTDSVWIGKLNGIDYRVEPGTDPRAIRRIKDGQTDDRVRAIYEALKDEAKVRWKESFKQVLGLELATQAGLDL